jgi:hypothetical protein
VGECHALRTAVTASVTLRGRCRSRLSVFARERACPCPVGYCTSVGTTLILLKGDPLISFMLTTV